MWSTLLWMLGKGQAPNGRTFTVLRTTGTPGAPQSFAAKPAAGIIPGIRYFLRYIAGME